MRSQCNLFWTFKAFRNLRLCGAFGRVYSTLSSSSRVSATMTTSNGQLIHLSNFRPIRKPNIHLSHEMKYHFSLGSTATFVFRRLIEFYIFFTLLRTLLRGVTTVLMLLKLLHVHTTISRRLKSFTNKQTFHLTKHGKIVEIFDIFIQFFLTACSGERSYSMISFYIISLQDWRKWLSESGYSMTHETLIQ